MKLGILVTLLEEQVLQELPSFECVFVVASTQFLSFGQTREHDLESLLLVFFATALPVDLRLFVLFDLPRWHNVVSLGMDVTDVHPAVAVCKFVFLVLRGVEDICLVQ